MGKSSYAAHPACGHGLGWRLPAVLCVATELRIRLLVMLRNLRYRLLVVSYLSLLECVDSSVIHES